MSISHDKVLSPETRHIPINFRLSRSLDGVSQSEDRSYLFLRSNCDLADHASADRQNQPGNKPPKRDIHTTRDETLGVFF